MNEELIMNGLNINTPEEANKSIIKIFLNLIFSCKLCCKNSQIIIKKLHRHFKIEINENQCEDQTPFLSKSFNSNQIVNLIVKIQKESN